MKFDKETAVVVIVCIILITLWHTFFASTPEQPQQAPATASAETAQAASVQSPAVPAAQPKPVPAAPAATKRAASIKNNAAEFFFNSNGILDEIVINDVKRTNTEEPVTFHEFTGNEPFTCDLTGWTFQSASVTKQSETSLTVLQVFRKEKEEVTIRKEFTVTSDTPALQCIISFSGSAKLISKVLIWG